MSLWRNRLRGVLSSCLLCENTPCVRLCSTGVRVHVAVPASPSATLPQWFAGARRRMLCSWLQPHGRPLAEFCARPAWVQPRRDPSSRRVGIPASLLAFAAHPPAGTMPGATTAVVGRGARGNMLAAAAAKEALPVAVQAFPPMQGSDAPTPRLHDARPAPATPQAAGAAGQRPSRPRSAGLRRSSASPPQATRSKHRCAGDPLAESLHHSCLQCQWPLQPRGLPRNAT